MRIHSHLLERRRAPEFQNVRVEQTIGILRLLGSVLDHGEDRDGIAAAAIYHGLKLVTGNLRHFERVPGLILNPILADSRRQDAPGPGRQ